MPRNEDQDEQRESPPRQDREESPGAEHTLTKAEGEEETIDQALRHERRRNMEH